MAYTELFLVLIQVELIIVISILVYMLGKHPKKKPDPLLKHLKDYIAEGYTIAQAKEKLEKIGFDKERTEKVLRDFLHN
ncbi:hypothetical protein H6503_05325 [Candidatus Woesearchaeota archaeon]|nr:hypothetical protein [Candidatus Woesearchaeota archaeon]